MIQNYKRKTDRPGWSKDPLKRALDDIKTKRRSLRAASTNLIPSTTLQRHLKEKVLHHGSPKLDCFKTAFLPDAKDELVILKIDN